MDVDVTGTDTDVEGGTKRRRICPEGVKAKKRKEKRFRGVEANDGWYA